jgi:hypothetical protein
MILMGTAFGIIFPLGMVLGVCWYPLGELRMRFSSNIYRFPFFLDCSLALARPGSDCWHYYRRGGLFPRPRP